MIYEVRSERPYLYAAREIEDGEEHPTTVTVETRRTDEKTARQDVEMLAMFGVKAWVVEIKT